MFSLFDFRFVGDYREVERQLSDPNNDSGFESTPPKRSKADTLFEAVPSPLVDLLEDGYNELYLTKPGSLVNSFMRQEPPPKMNSPIKVVKALSVSPNFTGGLRQQINRMAYYRYRQSDEAETPYVDLASLP